jgi:hypothetical protein
MTEEEINYFDELSYIMDLLRKTYKTKTKTGPKLLACVIHELVSRELKDYRVTFRRTDTSNYISIYVSVRRKADSYEVDFFLFDNQGHIGMDFYHTKETTYEELFNELSKEENVPFAEINHIVKNIERVMQNRL